MRNTNCATLKYKPKSAAQLRTVWANV